MELLSAEPGDLGQVRLPGFPCREKAKPSEYSLLQRDQIAGQDLLPADSFRFQTIRNAIVDILQKNNVRIEGVEIRKERAMASRAEDQAAFLVPERTIIRIDGQGVRSR